MRNVSGAWRLGVMDVGTAQKNGPAGRRAERHWLGGGVSLEGKLLLSFMFVLAVAIGATCLTFKHASVEQLNDMAGEEARQLAMSLALASEHSVASQDWTELNRTGRNLIKSRNILFVAFLDSGARAKTLASRDVELGLDNLAFNQSALMQVRNRRSAAFGEYVEVAAPVLNLSAPEDATDGGRRLLGYVVVGVSTARQHAQFQQVQFSVIGVAAAMLGGALPVAYVIIRRIFLPIRTLETMTRKITSGDLDVRIDIDRPDVIGRLARSFDEMVVWVKRQRHDLAAANHDLEHKVEQRTAELESANGRLSAEIAEKEQLMRAVSHDLNAPLRNISGMVEMLLAKRRAAMDPNDVRRLERIKSNVDLEVQLITELLELSRIKTERLPLETVDVTAIVSELREMFECDLRSGGVELVIDTALPMLRAERSRVRQVFQNLIDNAIKYIGAGQRREIHVGCEQRGSGAEFYVRDTGMGIDPDDLEKIFLIFRRGRNTTDRNISGKGVGLASVKSIVETYNGRIWVASDVGGGSTFRFTMDRKFLPQAAMTPGAARAA